jgi:hydrogenase maturation protease
MLILGCGNPDRSDDAADLLVARRFRKLGINTLECCGMLRLMEIWNGSKEVEIVDAVVSGAAPGTIHVWDALDGPLPRGCFPSSTHDLGVADAVELAPAVGRLPPKLILYGIEAAKFGRGESLFTGGRGGREAAGSRYRRHSTAKSASGGVSLQTGRHSNR